MNLDRGLPLTAPSLTTYVTVDGMICCSEALLCKQVLTSTEHACAAFSSLARSAKISATQGNSWDVPQHAASQASHMRKALQWSPLVWVRLPPVGCLRFAAPASACRLPTTLTGTQPCPGPLPLQPKSGSTLTHPHRMARQPLRTCAKPLLPCAADAGGAPSSAAHLRLQAGCKGAGGVA